MVFYICEKFHNNISNVFNLQSGHEANICVQRAKGKPELRFMCSARRLTVLYICVKFGENILDGIKSYGADTNDGSADGRTD